MKSLKIALQRILVPTDFSDESHAALVYGAALAETFGASLHLLHVLETIAPADPLAIQFEFETRQIEREIETAAWDQLRALLSSEDQARFHAELAIEWGLPAVEIIRYAKEHAIDLISIGTHGRGGLKRLLLGSVAESVVRGASCPVLTIHHPEREFVVASPGAQREEQKA
jgi:nucleotide-binding universal stress UspA family protein